MFDRLRDRLAARREWRRDGRRDSGPAPFDPIPPPAPGRRPGLLERLAMFAITTAFARIGASIHKFFAPTPGAMKGHINADELFKLVVASVAAAFTSPPLFAALDFILSFFAQHPSLIVPGPFLGGLLVTVLTNIIFGMRLKNQGAVSIPLPAGSIVPAGGAIVVPPPPTLLVNDLGPMPSVVVLPPSRLGAALGPQSAPKAPPGPSAADDAAAEVVPPLRTFDPGGRS